MTSAAFIMGVVPLVFSTGAGAEIRQAMGIAVFAGMLGVTSFGLFLTPLFFTFIGNLVDRFKKRALPIPAHVAAMLVIVVLTTWSGQAQSLSYVSPDAPHDVGQPLRLSWWTQFDDPILDALETNALRSNNDIHI